MDYQEIDGNRVRRGIAEGSVNRRQAAKALRRFTRENILTEKGERS